MGDILSQDEIDALLSATEDDRLGALLRRRGLDKQQIAGLYLYMDDLVRRRRARRDIVAACIEQALTLLGKVKLSPAESRLLKKEITNMVKEKQNAGKDEKKPPPSSQRIVTGYDFKHPARVNKDQLRTLENLHDNYARLLSCTLSGAMRAVVDVDTAFVDQTTYAEFITSLSNPSCSYQFTLGPTNGQAIIDVAMPLVFALVDRTFGGEGSSQGVTARQLSQIEMGVLHRKGGVVKSAIEDLEATWEPILPVEITDIELETNPEFMQITAASEIVILLAFEVNSTNASGLISLCYPFFTLESILPRLGQPGFVRRGRPDAEETARRNRARLANTYVPVKAELGRRTLSVKEARQVRVGDVLSVDTRKDEPAVVYVGDEPKFLGLPFTGPHGANTVKISQVLDREAAERVKSRSRPVQELPPEE